MYITYLAQANTLPLNILQGSKRWQKYTVREFGTMGYIYMSVYDFFLCIPWYGESYDRDDTV